MRVEGINAGQAPALRAGKKTEDAISMSLQKQIENAQKQMQDLAQNDQMPLEDKMKKRQELQKQITDLNQQLRQHEIELRRKQAEEAREKRAREAQENGSAEKEQEQGSGISRDSMNALLSADATIRQADAGDRIVTQMKGERNVLAGEIRMDKSRGVNTAKKEERLSDLEKRMDQVTGAQIKTLAGANKKLNETAEKEAGERTKDEKAKNKKQADENGMPVTGTEYEAPEGGLLSAEELAEKMEKEQAPGKVIDERL